MRLWQQSMIFLARNKTVKNFMQNRTTVSALKAIIRNLAASNIDVHISVDPIQIGYQIEEATCRDNAFEIAKEIKKVTTVVESTSRNFLMLDMEDSSVTEATIRLYEELTETSLPTVLTLQAYLYRTESDLQKIIRAGGAVRLVKGAFAEGKDVAFTNRSMIDVNFMKLATIMLSDEARKNGCYPIFATHDDTLIDKIIDLRRKQG
jgi:proline dehydrogenase